MSQPDYESISDVVLTTNHYEFLEAAGASDPFLELLRFPAEPLGIRRHSVAEEVMKYIYWGEFEADPAEFVPFGGGFFMKLWRGELFEAFLHADGSNRPLMTACFGTDRLIEDGVRSGQPLGYTRRMVTGSAL